jgi:hypothetical protein
MRAFRSRGQALARDDQQKCPPLIEVREMHRHYLGRSWGRDGTEVEAVACAIA